MTRERESLVSPSLDTTLTEIQSADLNCAWAEFWWNP